MRQKTNLLSAYLDLSHLGYLLPSPLSLSEKEVQQKQIAAKNAF